jgi:S1-C subfamily serine protease
VRVELRITSGSRAGERMEFDKAVVTIGRDPASDLSFHPELDASVSARHAELRLAGSAATIRDVGSTNGTFLNGERTRGERALADGDVIRLGADGPRVEYRGVAGAGAAAGAAGGAGAARPDAAVSAARAIVRFRNVVVGLGVLFVVGWSAARWFSQRDSEARAGLAAALRASRAETDSLRARLMRERSAGPPSTIATDLNTALSAAEARQRALFEAPRADYEAITAKNAAAMVFIAVEEADGGAVSSSGFNVAITGVVVTNRHVVQDAQGRPARRVKVIFDNARGEWRGAHVVSVSTTDDLAVLQIDDAGQYPVVTGISHDDGLRAGAPVAILGYPLGTSTIGMGGNINTLRPRSSLGVGVVSKVLADTLQVDAYASAGSSGSPVFDARGLVVGVVFGGAPESNGRIVYAVPSGKLAAVLAAPPRE